MKCYERLKAAAACSVPLVALETGDPAAAVEQIRKALVFGGKESPIVQWDRVRGVRSVNEPGKKLLLPKFDGRPDDIRGAEDLLAQLYDKADDRGRDLPEGAVVIVHSGHWLLDPIDSAAEVQAIWNLRDRFKSPARMLILLGPSFAIPSELQHDILHLTEPLPDAEALVEVIGEVCTAAGLVMGDDDLQAAAGAALGMTAFAAENLAAMAICKRPGRDELHLDLDGLWEAKRKKINQTPALKVLGGGLRFDQLGGLDQIKRYLGAVCRGKAAPRAIVYVDEIEKQIGSARSDNSGVAQDQLGQLLSYMQDREATGKIFYGPPGSGKSALAKSAGATFDIPTIQLDLGGAKGSLVGQSEQMIRDALKVIDAVSGGQTLWLATCNSMTALPPELRRRFKLGTWFFDLPSREERQTIWDIYGVRHERNADEYAELLDRVWTGAEIESCFDIAYRTGLSLREASQFVNPVAVHSRESIEALRAGANGRFLSASHAGNYQAAAAESLDFAQSVIEHESTTRPKAKRRFLGDDGSIPL